MQFHSKAVCQVHSWTVSVATGLFEYFFNVSQLLWWLHLSASQHPSRGSDDQRLLRLKNIEEAMREMSSAKSLDAVVGADSIPLIRLSLAIVACLAWQNRSYIDSSIAYIWTDNLHTSEYFSHDSFEVILASCFFAIYTTYWVVLDFYVPAAHIFRISESTASNHSWKGRESALFQETLWYTLPWILLDIAVPRRHLLLSHFAASPTFLRVVMDICLSLVLYDFLFFAGHYLLHRNRFLFRTVHYKHHAMGKSFNLVITDKIK